MPFELQYTINDTANNKSTTTLKLPTTFTIADYGSFAVQMATLLNDFIHGRILSAELCLPIDISGFTNNTVGPLSDVEEIGAFEFQTSSGTRVNLNIPGNIDGNTLPGTNVLDPTSPDVATVITAMEAGIGGVSPCDIGGVDITDVIFARENFRSSGRKK